MRRALTPARLLAVVSGLLALYSFARVVVLFFEALSVVSAARAEDEALLELCSSGQASGSGKMREACLKAHAERASPIFFKAVVQAVGTAFKDFSDTVGSPFKVAVLFFFIVSSVMLPVIPWARLLFGQPAHDVHGMPSNGVHYIGFAPPADRRSSVRRKFGKAMRAIKMRRHGGNDSDDDLEPGHTVVDVTPDTGGGIGGVPTPGWDDISLLGRSPSHHKME